MHQEIPLTDDERAAVDGDVAAIERLGDNPVQQLRECSIACRVAAGPQQGAESEKRQLSRFQCN